MSLIHFFAYNIIFICVTTYLVYYFFAKKNNSFIQFLNNTEKTKLSLKKIIVGFTFGFIFGFISFLLNLVSLVFYWFSIRFDWLSIGFIGFTGFLGFKRLLIKHQNANALC